MAGMNWNGPGWKSIDRLAQHLELRAFAHFPVYVDVSSDRCNEKITVHPYILLRAPYVLPLWVVKECGFSDGQGLRERNHLRPASRFEVSVVVVVISLLQRLPAVD